jgi:predicted ferric reductase
MTPQVWWYVARATGIVAWGLLATSVVWGLLLSTRLAHGRPTPAWLLDLHRFLGGAAVVLTALHLAGLVADTYVHFALADLLVPYASGWKPGPVALGIVSLYLLAAVEGTSLAMRRLPRRLWRAVHLTSYVLFWSATFHFILAGTDAGHPLARLGIDVTAAAVVFLTLVRILSPTRGPRLARPLDRRTGGGGAGGSRPRPPSTTTGPRNAQPAPGHG